jgi:germination protein YpeB
MLTMLATEVWQQANAAQARIGELPSTSGQGLNQLSKYIAQVGAYAYSLAQQTAQQKTVTNEQKANFTKLAAISTKLSTQLTEYENSMNDTNNLSNAGNSGTKFGQFMLVSANQTNSVTPDFSLSNNMNDLEGNFPEYPALMYDGPFSDHIEKREASFLKGQKEISQDDARAAAARFLNIPVSMITVTGESDSKMPAWQLQTKANGGDVFIDLTKAGGHIANLTSTHASKAANITAEDAVNKGKEYLKNLGYLNMAENYWIIEGNRITINYVYTENNLVVYPDLIQVGVALDDGSLVMVQARGYIMNHTQRKLDMPTLTLSQAFTKVSRNLTLLNEGKLCIIPTTGENEVLCYEFHGRGTDGNEYLVYINAKTGVEQQMFVLAKDESGTLVM